MKGGEVPPCLCSLALVLRAEDAAAHLFELHAVAIVPSAGFEPATSSLEPSCTYPFVLRGQKQKAAENHRAMRLLFGGYLCLKRCIITTKVTEIAKQRNPVSFSLFNIWREIELMIWDA